MSDDPAYLAFDPELVNLACHLAGCQPEDLMVARQQDDTLVVVVQPGPKHVYSAEQIAKAAKELHRRPGHAERASAPAEHHQHQLDNPAPAAIGAGDKPPKSRRAA
jgi:hypothetical protein